MYADETGNLDYEGSPNPQGGGASTYFGFGTATFTDGHAEGLLSGLHLRAQLSAQGLNLPKGFHVCDDSTRTRNQMFKVVEQQVPRCDATFLYKANAYDSIRSEGPLRLYKMAWWLHLKKVALEVAGPDDELYVIAAEFGTKGTLRAVQEALAEVCSQLDRKITLCVWRSPTSWGLQVADYGLWAVQRSLEGKKCTWYEPCIKPTLRRCFFPWGRP